jgi:hypothetical protein
MVWFWLFRVRFLVLFWRAAEVVFGQAVGEELEGVLWSIDKPKEVEVFGRDSPEEAASYSSYCALRYEATRCP